MPACLPYCSGPLHSSLSSEHYTALFHCGRANDNIAIQYHGRHVSFVVGMLTSDGTGSRIEIGMVSHCHSTHRGSSDLHHLRPVSGEPSILLLKWALHVQIFGSHTWVNRDFGTNKILVPLIHSRSFPKKAAVSIRV